MTYQEAEIYRDIHSGNLANRIPGLTYRAVLIATDNSSLREKERIVREIIHKGKDNNFVLQEDHDPMANWGVFVICDNPDLSTAIMPLKDYLAL